MAQFQGATRYKYYTPDNGPPNQGAPPGAPSPQYNPYAGYFAGPAFGHHQYQRPPGGLPTPYACQLHCHPLSTTFPPGLQLGRLPLLFPRLVGNPPSYQHIAPGPFRYGPTQASGPSFPCHTPLQPFIAGEPVPPPAYKDPTAKDPPPEGARVQGQLGTFADKSFGYIFPSSNCTFHLVNIKAGAKPWEMPNVSFEHQVYLAPTGMKIGEFIKACGAQKAGVDKGFPIAQCGVAQMEECGNGQWALASRFFLGDPPDRLAMTLADLGWNHDKGESGRGKPIWLVFLP